jgi:hypothetical protein
MIDIESLRGAICLIGRRTATALGSWLGKRAVSTKAIRRSEPTTYCAPWVSRTGCGGVLSAILTTLAARS